MKSEENLEKELVIMGYFPLSMILDPPKDLPFYEYLGTKFHVLFFFYEKLNLSDKEMLKRSLAMAGKRGNNEGCIFKNPRSGRFEARITMGYNASGKQQFKYFSAKTRPEVVEKLDKYKAELKKGTYIENSKLTVGEWIDNWFENYVINKVKTTTRIGYESDIETHLKPHFGRTKLIELKGSQIQKVYNQMLVNGRADGKGGLSPKSIRNIHLLLNNALEHAVKEDLLIKNPLKCVTLPRQENKEIEILTPEEQKKLVKECEKHTWGMAVILTLYSGMRLGEVLGLTWKDINFKKNTISINKQLSRLKDFSGCTKAKTKLYLRNETKTSSSTRTIAIADAIMCKLAAYKQKQDLERAYWQKCYNNLNLVFCRADGNLLDPKTFRDFYKKMLENAGVEHKTFHALRHTFATRALESGANIKVVSEILGHASIKITLDTYSHVSLDLQHETMQKMVDIFFEV